MDYPQDLINILDGKLILRNRVRNDKGPPFKMWIFLSFAFAPGLGLLKNIQTHELHEPYLSVTTFISLTIVKYRKGFKQFITI